MSTHPEGANFFIFLVISLSPVTLVPLWVDSQSKDQECKKDRHGQTRQSVKKTKTAAALFSLISCFQSADDLFYLATLARVLRPIWQVFFVVFFFKTSCVAFVEICSRSFTLPLRCSDKHSDRDSLITIVSWVGSLVAPPGGTGECCKLMSPPQTSELQYSRSTTRRC